MSGEFDLEKLKIHERLVGVEHQMSNQKDMVSSLKELIEQDRDDRADFRREISESMSETRTILFGDGKTIPGVIVRTDRLEQSHKVNNWVVRTCGAGFVGLVVNGVWKFFTHKPLV